MTRPRLLDLFCGAGGAAVGYHRAGFDVYGIDHAPQPNYPYTFNRDDALAFLKVAVDAAGAGRLPHLAAIHASPPCQLFSAAANADDRLRLFEIHGDLLTPTRELLQQTRVPYIIENVPGAPMRADVTLCGTMFGLGADGFELRRHRLFELGNWPRRWPSGRPRGVDPPRCRHRAQAIAVYGHGGNADFYKRAGGRGVTVNAQREAMGVDHWTTRDELAEAIPPAFTEWLGGELLAALAA